LSFFELFHRKFGLHQFEAVENKIVYLELATLVFCIFKSYFIIKLASIFIYLFNILVNLILFVHFLNLATLVFGISLSLTEKNQQVIRLRLQQQKRDCPLLTKKRSQFFSSSAADGHEHKKRCSKS